MILGKEHDTELRDVLVHVLRELGAGVTDKSWRIGDSQEVETLQVGLQGRTVTVQAETFIGLSITGEPELVDRVVTAVRRHTGSRDAQRSDRT